MTEKGIVEVFKAADFSNGNVGLPYFKGNDRVLFPIDAATIANRLLAERGVVVEQNAQMSGDLWCATPRPNATHTALLVNVQPIERKDTAESLLGEFVNAIEGEWSERQTELVKRARKVLEKK